MDAADVPMKVVVATAVGRSDAGCSPVPVIQTEVGAVTIQHSRNVAEFSNEALPCTVCSSADPSHRKRSEHW